jgi:hypothetical protein
MPSLGIGPSTFQYVKVVNGVGRFTLTVPQFLGNYVSATDNMVQFWRSGGTFRVDGKTYWAAKRLEFIGFIREHEFKRDRDGRATTTLRGTDINGLLDRRLVAYKDESSQATATAIPADNAMKDIVAENFTSTATDADRDLDALPGISLTVAADTSSGPNIEKSFAWRRVLDVLQEINEQSYTLGTEIFFDLRVSGINSQNSEIAYIFETYVDQPGRDMTFIGRVTQHLVASNENGNLVDEFYLDTGKRERNYIYVLGPGEGENRTLEERQDASRINISPFNRIEGFIDGSSVDPGNVTAEMQAIGDEELARYRPKIIAGGNLISTDRFQFGREWRHGDRMVMRVFNIQFNGIVRITDYKLQDGKETVKGHIRHSAT